MGSSLVQTLSRVPPELSGGPGPYLREGSHRLAKSPGFKVLKLLPLMGHHSPHFADMETEAQAKQLMGS